MSFAYNSSCYGSQIPSERENVPMSNDHQLLSGNLNHVQWSEDDIANVMAVLTNGEAFREVRAQLDALSIDTEDPLPMSNEHEPLSGGSNIVQLSDQEMANLVAAMEVYETSYKPCAESNSLSVDTENTLSMPNEHEPLPGGSNDVQWSEQNVTKLVAAMQSGVSSPEMRALVQAFYDDTDDFLRNIDDTLLAGPADAHVDRSQHCTTSAKRKSCHTTQFDNTSSIPQKQHKRRRLKAEDNTKGKGKDNLKGKGKEKLQGKDEDNIQGKFGPYTLADAHATVMVMPVDDPNPVDISSRKILDPSGESLRTRRYGVMELDDCSYVAGNGYVAKNLPPGLTRVRLCEWGDNPCGLFIEMDQYHVDQHMLYWHGIDARMNKKEIPCQYADCSAAAQKIQYLGRHIETVHFDTCWQCPYCMTVRSRIDVVRQHMKNKCKTLIAFRNQAQNGGNDFHPRELIPLFKGYIVPTTSAT